MIISKEAIPVPVRTAAKRACKHVKRIGKKALRAPERIREIRSELRSRRMWLSPEKIREYRTKIRVFDVFYFFNELDLLEIRLEILGPYVDTFVIIEATTSFTGHPKPLLYEENKDRFKRWEHKIVHYVIDDVPSDRADLQLRLAGPKLSDIDREIAERALTSDNIGAETHWLREFFIKESAKKALIRAGARDDDFCYISDVDEIWDPDLLIDYSKDSVFKLTQIPYVYFLNNRSDENWHGWTGTIATKYKNIRSGCVNHLRTHRKMMGSYVFLRNGGWHFTFQGGAAGAKRKIVDSDNPEYYNDRIASEIEDHVLKNEDHRGRNFRFWIDEEHLPRYLAENRSKYERMFKKPLPKPGKLSRSRLINMIISRFGYTTYLEIGVNTPAQPGYNWASVQIDLKHGVDPNPAVHATYPVPSDVFFEKHIATTYDIVFVDGLHIFEQAYRDIVNSLGHLAPNGTIVVHDCNPPAEVTQRRVRASHQWHGDVWKAILKLRMEEPALSIWTVNTDEGCAILRRGAQTTFVPEKGADPYTYDYFDAHRTQILNLISVREFERLLRAGL